MTIKSFSLLNILREFIDYLWNSIFLLPLDSGHDGDHTVRYFFIRASVSRRRDLKELMIGSKQFILENPPLIRKIPTFSCINKKAFLPYKAFYCLIKSQSLKKKSVSLSEFSDEVQLVVQRGSAFTSWTTLGLWLFRGSASQSLSSGKHGCSRL